MAEEEDPLVIQQRVECRHQPALEPPEQLRDRCLRELLVRVRVRVRVRG